MNSMERPCWITPDGRLLYKAETSRHHIFSERDWYRTPLQRRFREMVGGVVRLANQPHRELHANVKPPLLINPNLMADIYQFSTVLECVDAYDAFQQIGAYVGLIATSPHRSDRDIEEATLLHANLVNQAAFIEMGKLTLVEREVA